MDANKLKVLQEIGYTIGPHCGICKHSDLSADGWGYCLHPDHTYQHAKHSGGPHRISINAVGSCVDFEKDDSQTDKFQSFKEHFIE